MIQNRKGAVNFDKTINTGVIIIISIVLLLALYASLIPEAQKAGDSMNDSNRCSAVGCFYNSSITAVTPASNSCRSNASPDISVQTFGDNSTACTADLQSIPFSRLFGGQGIIITLLMVVALLVGLSVVLGKGKK